MQAFISDIVTSEFAVQKKVTSKFSKHGQHALTNLSFAVSEEMILLYLHQGA